MVKNPPPSVGDIRDTGSIPGSERSLGGGNGAHSNILAWRIPWTERQVSYTPKSCKELEVT